jgi:hypothetical protein
MKKCKTCSIEKPLTEFYTRKSGKENNIIYRKIEPQKRTPKGCGCDKVNAENVADGSKIKFSDFLTVEKVG